MKRCGLLMARHNSLTFKGTCYRCSSFLGMDPMRSKVSERKTTSVSHFWLVALVEAEEKLNPSGPFFLPVAHPRPRGQVIASGFVEKVMLGGLPGLNARIVEKNVIPLEAQRPDDPSVCGADFACHAQVISQIVQITWRGRECMLTRGIQMTTHLIVLEPVLCGLASGEAIPCTDWHHGWAWHHGQTDRIHSSLEEIQGIHAQEKTFTSEGVWIICSHFYAIWWNIL